MNPTIQQTQIRPTQLLRIANVAVASGAIGLLASPSNERHYLQIENVGLTTMWYGATSSMTIGATGLNMGQLAVNATKVLEGYGDYLYGMYHGASNAGAHVVKVVEY